MKAFAAVDDETEPSVGEEVGRAIAPAVEAMSSAIERIGEQNTQMQQAISKAMIEALSAVDSKHVVVENIKQWDFKIERGSDKLITRIVATAGTR